MARMSMAELVRYTLLNVVLDVKNNDLNIVTLSLASKCFELRKTNFLSLDAFPSHQYSFLR